MKNLIFINILIILIKKKKTIYGVYVQKHMFCTLYMNKFSGFLIGAGWHLCNV